uniref:UDP-glucuronic acid decarboxylase 1 n=1 Tax=Hordeum vulgare subsp. vulgare TaxID=112509 RepID=A0A8I6WGV7_HORVV
MASSELTYRGQPAAAADGARAAESKPRTRQQLPQPLRYVLGEQRLVFSLVGMALATLVFLLLSPSTTTTSTTSSVAHLAAVGLASRQYHSGGAGRMAYEEAGGRHGRVPLGLKRKGLRVVVTGGAGFVGSHLVDRLLARGDSVIVVDNFFTGRKENVAHHAGNPNFEMIRHDVVEPILLEVDQIYHLACPASPVHYKFNPVKTIKTNVVGTLNMLGLAKRVGARFLLTSTSEVYGDPLQHPQVETYWGNVNPIGVRSCYDEGKRTAETLTMDYHRGANLEVRIARIFNTYGPRMCIDDGRVVSNFVAQALRKEPLTVYGDGKQTRSFQYVSDLVSSPSHQHTPQVKTLSLTHTHTLAGGSPCFSPLSQASTAARISLIDRLVRQPFFFVWFINRTAEAISLVVVRSLALERCMQPSLFHGFR